MLDRFVTQVQSSTNPSLDSLKKLAGMDRKKQIPDERNIEPEFTEQDGMLDADVAKRMLKWHAEAIGRAVELSPHTELYTLSFSPVTLLISQCQRCPDVTEYPVRACREDICRNCSRLVHLSLAFV